MTETNAGAVTGAVTGSETGSETAAGTGTDTALPPGAAAGATPPPRRERRRLRAALRWASALLVATTAGSATAYAVTLPERTEIPGLKTPHDGRWTYPALKLPALPSGSPAPHDPANVAGRHHADPRALLLPVPEGAEEDRTFPGGKRWLDTGDYAELWADPKIERLVMAEEGLRHIAARAWTMPDGTRVETYLLRFPTAGLAGAYRERASTISKQASYTETDYDTKLPRLPDRVFALHRVENDPQEGELFLRHATITSGDTIGVVIFSRKEGRVPTVPYRQTVALQAQMLG